MAFCRHLNISLKNVALNKSGAKGLDEVLEKGNVALDVHTFEAMANHEGALVLDTRSPEDFAISHVPNPFLWY